VHPHHRLITDQPIPHQSTVILDLPSVRMLSQYVPPRAGVRLF